MTTGRLTCRPTEWRAGRPAARRLGRTVRCGHRRPRSGRPGRPRTAAVAGRAEPVRPDRGPRVRVEPAGPQPRHDAARRAGLAVRPGRAAGRAGRRAAGGDPGRAATARATLVGCPRIHLRPRRPVPRTASLIGTEVPGLLEQAPAMKSTVEPAAAAASRRWSRSASGRWPRRRAGRGPGPPVGAAAVGGQALAHPRHRADRVRGAAPGPGHAGRGDRSHPRGRGRAGRRPVRRRHRPDRVQPARRRASGRGHHRRTGPGDPGRDDRVLARAPPRQRRDEAVRSGGSPSPAGRDA